MTKKAKNPADENKTHIVQILDRESREELYKIKCENFRIAERSRHAIYHFSASQKIEKKYSYLLMTEEKYLASKDSNVAKLNKLREKLEAQLETKAKKAKESLKNVQDKLKLVEKDIEQAKAAQKEEDKAHASEVNELDELLELQIKAKKKA